MRVNTYGFFLSLPLALSPGHGRRLPPAGEGELRARTTTGTRGSAGGSPALHQPRAPCGGAGGETGADLHGTPTSSVIPVNSAR